MERIRKTEFLGREFLLWLWWRSETREGRFDLGEAGTVEAWVDRKIVLEGVGEGGAEKVTCTGDNPTLREARFALSRGKEVTEAMIRLVSGEEEWSFVLDARWLNFRSFKTPPVARDLSEDPEGVFYEKFFLTEKAVAAVDELFGEFIKIRVSPRWEAEEWPALLRWIREEE